MLDFNDDRVHWFSTFLIRLSQCDSDTTTFNVKLKTLSTQVLSVRAAATEQSVVDRPPQLWSGALSVCLGLEEGRFIFGPKEMRSI